MDRLPSNDVAISDINFSLAKLRAAVEARKNSDLIIIARTDAPDLDEVIKRGRLYLQAGADIVQPTSRGVRSYDDIKQLCDALGAKLSLQIVGWLERELSAAQLEEVASFATFPLIGLMSATEAMRENLFALFQSKSAQGLPRNVTAHDDFSNLIGFNELDAIQRRLLSN